MHWELNLHFIWIFLQDTSMIDWVHSIMYTYSPFGSASARAIIPINTKIFMLSACRSNPTLKLLNQNAPLYMPFQGHPTKSSAGSTMMTVVNCSVSAAMVSEQPSPRILGFFRARARALFRSSWSDRARAVTRAQLYMYKRWSARSKKRGGRQLYKAWKSLIYERADQCVGL